VLFRSPPVRVPLEPFGPSFRANRNRAFGRLASWLFYYLQTRRLRRELLALSIPSNDHVFGIYDSGAMIEDRILRLLDRLPGGVSEIYCHPATRRWEGPDNSPSSYQPENELAALLSPEVKRKMEAYGLRTSSYRAALS